MSRLIPLDSQRHRDLRVHPGHGLAAEDRVNLTPVVTAEFSALAGDYPIFLAQERETGAFNAVALLGFDEGENLFLEDTAWLAEHKPLNLQRQPFFADAGDSEVRLFIDLDSPRVGTRGEPLFDGDGRPAPYLDHIRSVLAELLAGMEATRAFIARVLDLDLVEAARLSVPFADGGRTLDGLFAVRPDVLAGLPDDVVLQLFRAGDLELIHLMMASLARVRPLARRRERRLAEDTTAAHG